MPPPAVGALNGGHYPFQSLAHLAGERGDGGLVDQLEHCIGVHEFHADVAVRHFADEHVTRQQQADGRLGLDRPPPVS